MTLLLTLAIESLVSIIFCRWRRKSVGSILVSLALVNLLTQSLLWLSLIVFYRHYLIALFSAEIVISLLEGIILYFVPSNRLSWRDAFALSLAANLTSFGIGWFLPV